MFFILEVAFPNKKISDLKISGLSTLVSFIQLNCTGIHLPIMLMQLKPCQQNSSRSELDSKSGAKSYQI